ncbi:MAG: GNAT family N-acetyltransferase [Propionibacteriaceae bacterium]
MTVSLRRVWRAAPATLTLVWIFTIAAVISIPALAYLIYSVKGELWLPILLGVLTLLTLVYAWRFGLHPRLRTTETEVIIRNPFRTTTFLWEDITLVASGENGLIIGSEDAQAEAWCIQKSNRATRKGRRTRSDKIVNDLLDMLDALDPPLEDADTGLRVRRARPDESRLLTRMERAASEAEFGHIFPPEEFPYPTAEVAKRWRGLLRDRLTRVHILELFDAPVGFVAFSEDTVLHLGVVPHQTRRGYGTALLEYATGEMFDRGVQEAHLWVMTDNETARSFYHTLRWRETDRRRDCEFPPFPEELEMVRPNPGAPRRSRGA